MISILGRSPKAHRRTNSTPTGLSGEAVLPRNASHSGLGPGSGKATATDILPNVPENEEMRSLRRPGSLGPSGNTVARMSCQYPLMAPRSDILPKNRDWIRLQQKIRGLFKARYVHLQPGELAILHERIRALSGSKAGPFVFDSYKREVEVCLTALAHNLKQVPRENLLDVLSEEWENLYTHVLPTLDMILYIVKGKGSESVRHTFLVTLRNIVVTKLELEDLLNGEGPVPDNIRHMLLILYNVNDSYPPTKAKLKLETLLARLVSPFLGFQGLYEGGPEPVIKSSEPELVARRKSNDGVPLQRKLSRPMGTQPRQIETLHELFLTALRKQPDF